MSRLRDLLTLANPPETTTASDKSSPRKIRKQKDDNDDDTTPLIVASGNEIAHRALARDHIERGEFEAATEELGDAAALNQRDMWIRYYLSVLKYRVSKANHTDMQGLPNMMQDLRAVLEWYPEFADAYDLLAMARLVGGGSVAAMQSERAAINSVPAIRNTFFTSPKFMWVIRNGPQRRTVEPVEDQQQSAGRGRSEGRTGQAGQRAEVWALGRFDAPKLAAQRSPFDVLEQDAAKRAAEAQANKTLSPTGVRNLSKANWLRWIAPSLRSRCSPLPRARSLKFRTPTTNPCWSSARIPSPVLERPQSVRQLQARRNRGWRFGVRGTAVTLRLPARFRSA